MTPVTLRDGSVVTLRAIRPEDEARLSALYVRLSPETAYQRFFTVMRRLPPDWARILAQVDGDRQMAIVAEGPAGELIGVVRYATDATGEAELALVVQDAWQNRGLGTRLLTELLDYARGRGITRFRAHVLSDNRRMLDMFGRLLRVVARSMGDGVTTLRLALPDAGPGVSP